MDSGPQLDGLFWPVPDLELLHFLEEGQCHGGDLARVPVGVPLGQPADHHVGVADRLHLVENRSERGPSGLGPNVGRSYRYEIK